jgi:hypothetical protein
MFDTGEELTLGRTVAPPRVGHDHPWSVASALQQLAEECLGRLRVALALHTHVEDMALRVHSPPAIVRCATDGQQQLIAMPRVARSRAPTAQLMGIGWPKLPAPLPGERAQECVGGARPEHDIARHPDLGQLICPVRSGGDGGTVVS